MATRIITLWVHAEPIEGECETCGYDALRRITAHQVTAGGVRTHVDKAACGRCAAERRRNEREE